jgi:hypothetical protein
MLAAERLFAYKKIMSLTGWNIEVNDVLVRHGIEMFHEGAKRVAVSGD